MFTRENVSMICNKYPSTVEFLGEDSYHHPKWRFSYPDEYWNAIQYSFLDKKKRKRYFAYIYNKAGERLKVWSFEPDNDMVLHRIHIGPYTFYYGDGEFAGDYDGPDKIELDIIDELKKAGQYFEKVIMICLDSRVIRSCFSKKENVNVQQPA